MIISYSSMIYIGLIKLNSKPYKYLEYKYTQDDH